MYTLEEIAALRQKCLSLKLDNAEILLKYTDAELQAICNGIGPDAFPDQLRDFISTMNPTLQPAAFIHDVEWYESTGDAEDFSESNSRLRQNGDRCAEAEYRWYNPLRYYVMWKAQKFAALCQFCGLEFYKQSKKESTEHGCPVNT